MAPVSALLRASVPTATVFKCPSSGATLDRPRQTRCPSRPLKGASHREELRLEKLPEDDAMRPSPEGPGTCPG